MTRPVTALCNECGKITDVEYKEQKHPNEIWETYFKCEHCYYHYTCFVTDKWVRKKHKVATQLRAIKQVSKLEEIQNQINERMSRLKYNLINFGRADL